MILFKPFLKILFLAFALVVIATPPRGGKLVMPRSDDGLQDIVSFPVIASSSQTYNLHNNTGHMGQVLYIHQRCKNSYYIWRVSSIQVRGIVLIKKMSNLKLSFQTASAKLVLGRVPENQIYGVQQRLFLCILGTS